jgi:hypothetical protein
MVWFAGADDAQVAHPLRFAAGPVEYWSEDDPEEPELVSLA